MKALLILLSLLLLISIRVHSQPKIKTRGSLELGYEDRLIRFTDNTGTSYGSSWLNKREFADIHLNASYKKLSIYTNVKTYFECEKFYRYDPLQVEYWVGLTYEIGRIEFCGEHMCSHSITKDFFHEAHNKFSAKINLWGD